MTSSPVNTSLCISTFPEKQFVFIYRIFSASHNQPNHVLSETPELNCLCSLKVLSVLWDLLAHFKVLMHPTSSFVPQPCIRRRKQQPTPSTLPGKSYWLRAHLQSMGLLFGQTPPWADFTTFTSMHWSSEARANSLSILAWRTLGQRSPVGCRLVGSIGEPTHPAALSSSRRHKLLWNAIMNYRVPFYLSHLAKSLLPSSLISYFPILDS